MHEEQGVLSQQKPFFRFFSSLISDLHSIAEHLDSASRPSPIPFHTQPSHPPELCHTESHYQTSPPQLAVVLPPHSRPIGPGHASHISPSVPIALPPIATLSPTSSIPSPSDDHMILNSNHSSTPPLQGKLSEVMNPAAGSSMRTMSWYRVL
ncbi:uncharacterized protein F5147DRAFT_808682 [Suillus discolor]|uniref:Uncharacterized protein n=1 Tax=Suillus discolor TaxID=1912936 RepID=A0A9P7F1W6_9AGAM|nr:uncharacterized protein F5147DRAFT_808682 [Suillus discolor]KAG2103712.1 hypothetical protein F5147DRAFT_808682 [Suillus discolor]